MSVGREEFLCPFRSIRSFDDTKVSHGYTHHIHTGREGKKGVLPTLALQSLSEPKFGLGLSATCLSYHPFFFFFFSSSCRITSTRKNYRTRSIGSSFSGFVSFRFVHHPTRHLHQKKKKKSHETKLPSREVTTRHSTHLAHPLAPHLTLFGSPRPVAVCRKVGGRLGILFSFS